MAGDPFIMVPRDAADRMLQAEDNSGDLAITHLPSEELYVVTRIELRSGARIPVNIATRYQTLKWTGTEYAGQWFRRPMEHINLAHLDILRRPGAAIPLETFRSWVPGVDDPGNAMGLVITIDPDLTEEQRRARAREFAGWIVTRDGVHPIDVAVEPEQIGLQQLADKWPLDSLSHDTVMVVGLGSIGGSAAEQLAAMGVGQTLLVDPDRFLWHNEVRHVLDSRHVGRLKVDAMKTYLCDHWPQVVQALPVDVVNAADLIRPLMEQVDLVLCAADGIAPRRIISHLAKRAGRPSIHACVLNDGGIGEILRLRPGPRFGCLLCHRAHLAATGGIDPEADQELEYGTGLTHKPMTATPTDLHLVGTLAAKVAVATLLEGKHGHPFSLPGEHAVLGLRSGQELAAPFDAAAVGAVTWHDIPGPRPDCATCAT